MYSELTKMEGKRIVIRTFGYFDIFVDGETIPFSCKKAKELLALLVDRRGGFVTTGDAISYLWEDECTEKRTKDKCIRNRKSPAPGKSGEPYPHRACGV